MKATYPFFRIVLLPVMLLVSIIFPRHTMIDFWNIPINKMINHIAGIFYRTQTFHCSNFCFKGYIVFLILIFLESNRDRTNQRRKPPTTGLEPFIIIFVIGNIWNTARMCLLQGPKRYFKYLWNWHAIINNTLFLLTFLFWLASEFDYIKYDQVNNGNKLFL